MKQNEIANLCYKGNSVGYIHDKMKAYRDQIFTMAGLLKAIGIDYANSGNNNNERISSCLDQIEVIREKLNKGSENEKKSQN